MTLKKLIDTHGHVYGGSTLQLLSIRLKHNLRFQDTPFVYGGDEFVVLLANTTGEEALIVARRLNRIVNEQPFVINNHQAINVTISLGTACLQNNDDEQGTSLLDRADQCLLEAKATGRNKVIGWDLSDVSYLKAASS